MLLEASPIVAEYRRRTQTSAALAAEARGTFPSGITHDSRHLSPYPIYVARAAGSRKWDVDGNEYVDYTGGHGALLLGHAHPEVAAAVARQLPLGTHYGASHELELRWGQWVQRLIPCAQRVRFTSSGTEATMLALRLARAATGKNRILRFRGHFHGWHDHAAFGVSSHFDGRPTPGVLPDLASQVVLGRAGDVEDTRRLLDAHPDLAAVIFEPTGGSWGQTPLPPSFVHFLREETARRGIVLIFDEVISGFRCAPGGAQEALGITADLATFAKILAGGLPGGAVAGRADLMEHLQFTMPGQPQREKVPHQGTFNANPLSAAAGVATLEIVSRGQVCRQASDFAAHLREALSQVVRDERLDWVVYGTYSGFHLFTNPQHLPISAADFESGRVDYTIVKQGQDPALLTKLRLGMLIHGVEIFNWPGGPTSAVHSPDDLAHTVEALRGTIRMLRAEGAV